MHPAHPLFQGYMISKEAYLDKEADISDIARYIGRALSKGKIKGIPTEWLTAGGSGIITALLGALLAPGNRWLGALGGGLLGSGLGYLGGYYGKDKIKSLGKDLENWGIGKHLDKFGPRPPVPGPFVDKKRREDELLNPIGSGSGKYGPDKDKEPRGMSPESLTTWPQKEQSLKLKLKLALHEVA